MFANPSSYSPAKATSPNVKRKNEFPDDSAQLKKPKIQVAQQQMILPIASQPQTTTKKDDYVFIYLIKNVSFFLDDF